MPSSSDSKIRKGAFRPNSSRAPSREGLTYGAGVADDNERTATGVVAAPWRVVLPLEEALAKAEHEVCVAGTIKFYPDHPGVPDVAAGVINDLPLHPGKRSSGRVVLLGIGNPGRDYGGGGWATKVRGTIGGKKGKYGLTNIRVK